MQNLTLPISESQLADFCRRWKVRELALFGSALREDFSAESDIDLLVTFIDDAEWSLLDHIAMQQELEDLLQRKVDLISRYGVEHSSNRLRRDAILKSARPLFAA